MLPGTVKTQREMATMQMKNEDIVEVLLFFPTNSLLEKKYTDLSKVAVDVSALQQHVVKNLKDSTTNCSTNTSSIYGEKPRRRTFH